MIAIDGEGRKMEMKKHDVLFSLSTVLTAVQKVVHSKDIYRILQEELLTHGFHCIALELGKKDTVKISCLSLPPKILESLKESDILQREINVKTLPHYEELMKKKVVLSTCEEVFPDLLRIPGPALQKMYTQPYPVVLIPILQQDCILVVASDTIKEEELPVFSAFKDLMEVAISNVKLLEEMKEQKEFSERIIKSVQECIMIEDSEGMITFVNPRIVQLLGYTEEELISHHYSVIACPDYIELAEEETRKRPRGIQSQYEMWLMHKDGSPIPVIVSATPLFERGEYVGTLTVFTDISAQKKAEKEIRSLKEFSENIIQSMHEGVIIEDEKGIITFVNRKIEELLERKREEIIGHHWRELTAPEYIQKMEEETARRAHGISGQYEAALLTRSKRQVPIMVGSTPLFENGQFRGVVSVCVDLTVVKEKEKEIRQKNEDLNLLSKINHGLNTGQDLRTILDMTVLELQEIFDSDAVAIISVEKDKKSIPPGTCAISSEVREVLHIEPGEMPELSFPIGKGSIVEKTIKNKESYLIQEQNLDEIFTGILTPEMVTEIRNRGKVKSCAVLPLVADNEVIGVMFIGSRRELNQNDFNRLKSLSRHLALAADHARLDETFQKTSLELQTSLSEQILLRELVEKFYLAKNREEVMEIATEGLKRLKYEYSAIWLREKDHLKLSQIHAKGDVIAKVAEIIREATGKVPDLERISLQGKGNIFREFQEKRKALVTDNIKLQKEVLKAPMSTFIELWIDTDSGLEEVVSRILGVRSAICIPFQIEKEFSGIFAVGSEDILEYHDFVVLETLGQIINEALGKLQYSDVLEKKSKDLEFSNRQLSLLQEINNALNSTMDLEEILKILVRGINSVFGYDAPSVYLLSDDREYLLVKEFDINSKLLNKIMKLVGFSLEDYRIPLFEGSLLRQVIEEKKPLVTNDVPRLLRDYTREENLRRLAGALHRLGNVEWVTVLPLIAGVESVGMLVFGSRKKVEQEDIDALSGFLNQTALAIAKARLYEELKEANQMKSEFIDITSHELRTPLTAIKLYLEMMKMGRYGVLSSELDEKVGLLQASAERLQEIIDKTLISSRILKRKLEIKKEDISLVELVRDVKAQLRPSWETKRQRIDVEGPYKLPLVKADRDGMWKVITVLLDNALKYSPEGSRITVKLYDLPEEVEVAVMDEGVGIQQEYLQKIFEEFFIIPSETEYARMDGRTGLGLFIAKGIVEEHKGRIWVESVYGLGSTFHFTLPKSN